MNGDVLLQDGKRDAGEEKRKERRRGGLENQPS
jgi:hypothetical protein